MDRGLEEGNGYEERGGGGLRAGSPSLWPLSSVVLHLLDELDDYSVGVRHLEVPLTPGLSLDRRRDLHALPLQSRVLLVNVVDDEDDQHPVRVPPAHALGLEALKARAKIDEVEARVLS